eukprot:CAMPEP_0175019960 /NCGR_PEP_ID=MMETSP0005-20121125/13860_1 /TAXON_ID=420556 /ORGANISM="Ochromonas sp., Strain CCMP1393" /LENGTH=257 /DNA_ID=CAMNT_0016277777 /DNA_START=87 /DNA_END=857 /DNA_ORIENTATION=+
MSYSSKQDKRAFNRGADRRRSYWRSQIVKVPTHDSAIPMQDTGKRRSASGSNDISVKVNNTGDDTWDTSYQQCNKDQETHIPSKRVRSTNDLLNVMVRESAEAPSSSSSSSSSSSMVHLLPKPKPHQDPLLGASQPSTITMMISDTMLQNPHFINYNHNQGGDGSGGGGVIAMSSMQGATRLVLGNTKFLHLKQRYQRQQLGAASSSSSSSSSATSMHPKPIASNTTTRSGKEQSSDAQQVQVQKSGGGAAAAAAAA